MFLNEECRAKNWTAIRTGHVRLAFLFAPTRSRRVWEVLRVPPGHGIHTSHGVLPWLSGGDAELPCGNRLDNC